MSLSCCSVVKLSGYTRRMIETTHSAIGFGSNSIHATLQQWTESTQQLYVGAKRGLWTNLDGIKVLRGEAFSVYLNRECYRMIEGRLSWWNKQYSELAQWVPKGELSAFWSEVKRLNAEQIKALVDMTYYKDMLSPVVESRLLADNARLCARALDMGLSRTW